MLALKLPENLAFLVTLDEKNIQSLVLPSLHVSQGKLY
jgi:hypothetical protein